MYIYKKDEQQITKCLVLPDEVELRRIRQLVIKDCSVIEEECVERTDPPKTADPDKIFDVRRGDFVREYDEQQGPTRKIYKYHYKERQYSRMVGWIDNLLEEDATILKSIYAGKPEEKESGLRAQLARLYEECGAISDSEFDKKIAALSEIKRVAREVEINEGAKPEFYYYDDLLSHLQPTPVSVISIEDFNRALEFIGKTPKELGMTFVDNIPAFGEVTPENYKQM